MNKHKQMMIFKAIVEAGSISKAADKLELSKSVLSTHLKQLESELATDLLKRTTRKQSLTPAGERFYQHCITMNDVMSTAWDDIRQLQKEPSGKLSITAPIALMESIVVPALSDAFAPFPDVSLNLVAEDKQLDLMQHDIDLAIRVGESPDSNVKQKRIGQFRDVLCQSVESHQSPETAKYIANNWQPKTITHLFHDINGDNATELSYLTHHKVNTVSQVASLIRQDMGIGLLPDFMLSQYPDLRPCFKQKQLMHNNVYALHPYSKSPPTSVIRAIDAIEKRLKSVTEF
ncbi:LysR family transcriptional regulator [Vibrio sp. St2]|uniref:LysR family transcriptional regulator n=1 Tax=Vibrio sp. St2 TaxID=2853441 RepID=UPI00248E1422|nr:LysR family transcriptional regulator [Vibrio sp. St2]